MWTGRTRDRAGRGWIRPRSPEDQAGRDMLGVWSGRVPLAEGSGGQAMRQDSRLGKSFRQET